MDHKRIDKARRARRLFSAKGKRIATFLVSKKGLDRRFISVARGINGD